MNLQDANGRDLTQFERWYLQAGTPTVKATDSWDAETGTYSLTLGQKVPDTPGQVEKLPMQVPVRVPLAAWQSRFWCDLWQESCSTFLH